MPVMLQDSARGVERLKCFLQLAWWMPKSEAASRLVQLIVVSRVWPRFEIA
jgi:hypothetical protein